MLGVEYIQLFLPLPRGYGFTPVCLFYFWKNYANTYEWMLINVFGKVRHGPRTNQLTFGDDTDLEHSVADVCALVYLESKLFDSAIWKS